MQSSNCLNCGTPVDRKFCPECGQKTDTHRITPQHFIMHDLVHGVMHLDKGILFTLKETFIRPGYAARDYVAGRRKNYYNIFYLIFLLLGIYMVAQGHDAMAIQIDSNPATQGLPTFFANFYKFVFLYAKYLVLVIIPILALSGFIVFQKLNYNYAEHQIISGFVMLGSIILILAAMLIEAISQKASVLISIFSPLLFAVLVYYQATKNKYSLLGYIWRMIPFFVLSLVWSTLFMLMLVVLVFKL